MAVLSAQNIKDKMNELLEQMVYAQDAGVPVGEVVSETIGLSQSYAFMIAVHEMRLKMVNQKLHVIKPPTESSFIIGFENKFGDDCEHVWERISPLYEKCTKCNEQRDAYDEETYGPDDDTYGRIG